MRGNPVSFTRGIIAFGSIPAYAGEPIRSRKSLLPQPVYPRVCGGTPGALLTVAPAHGLSPRMRGNLARSAHCPAYSGSIPAYAGEPPASLSTTGVCWVYPRVCGGTWCRFHRPMPALGLSPRMRGNHALIRWTMRRPGSIPAYAGEPSLPAKRLPTVRVYPRVCGGTDGFIFAKSVVQGLSPRMRGNHRRWGDAAAYVGSIPAYAGEPTSRKSTGPTCKVYPRVCGGTPFFPYLTQIAQGLSPRMRGNRVQPPDATAR